MVQVLIAIFSGAGGLAGIYALIRYWIRAQLVKHALGDERGVEAVEAVARAMHPGLAAAKRHQQRRRRTVARKKPPSIRSAS